MKALTKKTKKIIAAVLICAAVILIIAVSTFNNSVTIECGVDKTSDGSIVLKFDTQDVKDAGIEIGDSVDIKFDTGYNVEDVPILNGPFMNSGSHIITAANEDSDYIFQIQDEDDI